MKKKEYIYLMKCLYSIYFILFSYSILAQTVGVNSTGAVPATSAMLDVFAADKGLLIPRVDIIDLNTSAPVSSPTTSLLVYNTNVTSGVGYYFWNGSKWINLKDSNSNSDEDWYEVGTTTSPDDISDDIFTMGKVGIGLNNPLADFHLKSSKDALFGNLDDFQRGTVHIRGGENEVSGRTGKKSALFVKNGFGTSTSLHVVEEATSSGHIGLLVGKEDKTAATLMTLAGKVGVGTMSPNTAFHVSHSGIGITSQDNNNDYTEGALTNVLHFTDKNDDLFGWVGDGSSGQKINLVSYFGYDIELATFTSNTIASLSAYLRLDASSGNTGVGVTVPKEKLDVLGNIQLHSYSLGIANGIFFRDGFNSSLNPYNLSITTDNFNGDGTPDALSINAFEGVSISTGHNTTLQRRLTVINNGNVGIGTIVPNSLLHLDRAMATGDVAQLQIENASGSALWLGQNHSLANGYSFIKTHASEDLYFQLGQATDNVNPDVVFKANGKVGIGTLSPSGKLEVETGGSESSLHIDASSSSGTPLIRLQKQGVNKWGWLGEYPNSGMMSFFSYDLNQYVMVALNNGNVGIGSISPSYQFQVSTNSAAKPTSNTWTVASDRRLKTNVKNYDAGLDDILKINPVWFTYTGKAGMPKDTGVGIIAQDLQEIAPYMVNEWTYDNKGTKESYLGVDNGAMTYMLINAVKELKAENEKMKKRLEKLEKLNK